MNTPDLEISNKSKKQKIDVSGIAIVPLSRFNRAAFMTLSLPLSQSSQNRLRALYIGSVVSNYPRDYKFTHGPSRGFRREIARML